MNNNKSLDIIQLSKIMNNNKNKSLCKIINNNLNNKNKSKYLFNNQLIKNGNNILRFQIKKYKNKYKLILLKIVQNEIYN